MWKRFLIKLFWTIVIILDTVGLILLGLYIALKIYINSLLG